MASHGAKTRADALIAAALATGATQEDAAKAAGVSLRTVTRRLLDPAFRRLVDATQDAAVERMVGAAVSRLAEAVNKLGALVNSRNEMVALGACRAVVDTVFRLREHQTLTRRLTALEESTDERDGPGAGTGAASGSPTAEPGLGADAAGTESGPGAHAHPVWDEGGPVAREALAGELEPGALPGIETDWEV